MNNNAGSQLKFQVITGKSVVTQETGMPLPQEKQFLSLRVSWEKTKISHCGKIAKTSRGERLPAQITFGRP